MTVDIVEILNKVFLKDLEVDNLDCVSKSSKDKILEKIITDMEAITNMDGYIIYAINIWFYLHI